MNNRRFDRIKHEISGEVIFPVQKLRNCRIKDMSENGIRFLVDINDFPSNMEVGRHIKIRFTDNIFLDYMKLGFPVSCDAHIVRINENKNTVSIACVIDSDDYYVYVNARKSAKLLKGEK